METWHPLMTGEARDKAMSVALSVADDIAEKIAPASLAARDPYITLLFAYLGRSTGEARHYEVAERIFAEASDDLERFGSGSRGLFGGLAGLVWLDAHLDRHFAEPEPHESSVESGPSGDGERAADCLAEFLDRPPEARPYELLGGLAGLGVAWLEWLPDAPCAGYLARLVDAAEVTAVKTRQGVTWRTLAEWIAPWQRARYPSGNFNLGVAQGIPGLLAVLARIGASGIERTRCEKLVAGGFAWLLAKREPGAAPWLFPAHTTDGPTPAFRAHRWCYTGLGVGGALLASARLLGSAALENEARTILRSVAVAREPLGVVDSGLCHGFAGNGHIFNRAFQLTGDPALGDAARFWLERAIDQHTPGRGLGGYRSWGVAPDSTYENRDPPHRGAWVEDPSWLTGAAGTALALLAAVDAHPPAWDSLLGLSG